MVRYCIYCGCQLPFLSFSTFVDLEYNGNLGEDEWDQRNEEELTNHKADDVIGVYQELLVAYPQTVASYGF